MACKLMVLAVDAGSETEALYVNGNMISEDEVISAQEVVDASDGSTFNLERIKVDLGHNPFPETVDCLMHYAIDDKN